MILDEVLDEAYSQFNSEDMTDSFVEGFLYAMELQESGSKLRDIDELAETLNEISANYITDKVKKGMEKAKRNEKLANSEFNAYPFKGTEKEKRYRERATAHLAVSNKLKNQSKRIMNKLSQRTLG